VNFNRGFEDVTAAIARRINGEPGTGEPGNEKPTNGEPAYREPGNGNGESGTVPGTGEPANREPGTGEPGTGEPGTGEPGTTLSLTDASHNVRVIRAAFRAELDRAGKAVGASRQVCMCVYKCMCVCICISMCVYVCMYSWIGQERRWALRGRKAYIHIYISIHTYI
jgi:hypothetical protein